MRALLFLLLFSFFRSYAQQGILISNYHEQKMLFNPAAAGISDNIEIVGAYRNQWGGIQDNPKEYILSMSSPLGETNSSLGMNFNLDKIGPMSNFSLHGNYAYRFQIKEETFLQLGVRAGLDFGVVNNRALDGFYKGDPNFQSESSYYNKPVLGIGAYYQNDLFSIGASVPDLIPGVYDIAENKKTYSTVNKLYCGLDFRITLEERWILKPAFQYRFNANSPDNFDIYSQIEYNKFISFIGGYRSSGAFLFGAQYEFNENNFPAIKNKIKLCYNFDLSSRNPTNQMGSSHEITIRINIGEKLDRGYVYGRW
jgi:type IX secretion system PorP/SprF family membrane protein